MVMNEGTITVILETPCATMANEDDLRDLARHTLAQEGVRDAIALTLVVVDDPTIHDLNRQFLDHDEPTDVITFSLDDGDETASGFVLPAVDALRQLGEIYISCERAAVQSADWGSDPVREIRFLTIHGILHLLGWDDATPDDRARMLARQEEILNARPTLGQVSR